MQHVKVVVVGDSNTGKTCLLSTYKSHTFPAEYIPTVLNNFSGSVTVDDQHVGLSLWDTAGNEEYDRQRPLTYPDTDVFILCFAINLPTSFGNIFTKWLPELMHLCPHTPVILVGTKIDLRDCEADVHGRVLELGPNPITTEQGEALARKIKAVAYLECSALTQQNLNEVFEAAVKVVMYPAQDPPPRLPPQPEPPVVAPVEFTDARFASLIDKKEFSDVTFRVQDKEIYAHKVMLSASSPLFQKIFVHGSTELPPMFTIINTKVDEEIESEQLEHDTNEWKREEHVTIEVKDFSYEAFLVVLTSCYTALPPSPHFSISAVTEGLTFFQRYPRFTSDERKRFLLELTETANNNNNKKNITIPPLADMCIELPSKKRVLCHKAILAAGSDYFRTVLTKSKQNITLQVDMTDVEFSSVQQFFYTGTVNFDNKPSSYSMEILPKLARLRLNEYASHCACHLRDSVHDEDKSDAHGYVLSVLTLAEQLDTDIMRHLREYCIWWMQVNFDTINEHSWFKNEMTMGNREEVVRGQWPGVEYHQLYDEWSAINGKKGKRRCLVQ
eukprot:TRINITY_DN5010_c0_g1_i1.p1 TRINITY_DN5010_c0_g1~~TRINITY_DN5010_c0_g1_i1.p1  ORF type:complete len:557 (-),score=66.05 TRINITY_DN5010_c0_g1_i1:42-1712(-)